MLKCVQWVKARIRKKPIYNERNDDKGKKGMTKTKKGETVNKTAQLSEVEAQFKRKQKRILLSPPRRIYFLLSALSYILACTKRARHPYKIRFTKIKTYWMKLVIFMPERGNQTLYII